MFLSKGKFLALLHRAMAKMAKNGNMIAVLPTWISVLIFFLEQKMIVRHEDKRFHIHVITAYPRPEHRCSFTSV